MKIDEAQRTILLVEDEIILAMSEKLTLEKKGYRIITAETGESAVEAVSADPDINLILMDIDLGKGIDGTQAAEIILKDRDIPIVFLSSHTEPEIVEKTEKITSYGYVVKNSSITVLDASIKMAFRLFDARQKELHKEELLKESESQFRLLFQNINTVNSIYEVVYGTDGKPRDYRFLEVSPTFEKMVGIKAADLIGKTLLEVFPETESYWLDTIAEAAKARTTQTFESYSRILDAYTNLTVYSFKKGKIAITALDVSERRRAEIALKDKNKEYETLNEELSRSLEELQEATEELQAQNEELMQTERILTESENRFSLFMDYLPAIVFLKDSEGKTLFVNKYMDTALGASAWMGKNMLDVFPGEFGQKLFLDDMRVLETGYEKIEESIPHADGSFHDYETQKFVVLSADQEPLLGGIALDITGRHTAEESLRKNQVNYENLFNSVDDFILILDPSGRIVHTNTTVIDRLGFSGDELEGKSILELFPPERVEEINNALGASTNGTVDPSPVPLRTKSGISIPVETKFAAGLWDEKPVLFAVAKDISKIMLSEEKFSKIFHLNPSPCGLSDMSTNRYIEVNDAFCALLGFERSEVINRTAVEIGILTSEAREKLRRKFDGKGNVTNAEIELRTKTGETLQVLVSASAIVVQDKRFQYIVIQDISDRKRAEQALRKKNKELNRYFTSSLDLLCIADTDGHFVRLNPEWEKVLGYTIEDLEGRRFLDLVHPDDFPRTNEAIAKLALQEAVLSFENRYRCKDGSFRWIEWRSRPEGSLIYAAARDITERKLADDTVKALLAEKEMTLKEVHHRIKNNLTTISGLLSLQAAASKDTIVIAALEDARNRLKSMQLLYEKLYSSTSFTEISVNDYFSPLIDEIIANFPNAGSVQVEKKLENFILDSKRIQPLGIIFNELLTNIMKYAFTGRTNGIITVSTALKDNRITVVVQDNGWGMPESVNFEDTKGFGLTLVSGLARQLKGTVRIERTAGTRVVLEFDK